jgi:hypothetical protein
MENISIDWQCSAGGLNEAMTASRPESNRRARNAAKTTDVTGSDSSFPFQTTLRRSNTNLHTHDAAPSYRSLYLGNLHLRPTTIPRAPCLPAPTDNAMISELQNRWRPQSERRNCLPNGGFELFLRFWSLTASVQPFSSPRFFLGTW